ncbi:hypothetical protein HELRODRAFT_167722 [Helobdella robusta]|uniref:SUEL-type lectin domain-containing protein n=1 Tax=Helobdella robusta TaxID=6412 RepID=T1EZQ3_HELRO|nr:hypothetical protein HELRODRAFT_167722 [Helobdella robusta]ESO09904.1 hypothetical protein HELRODRAFT_167722 [Helobdella robusta]
MARTLCINLSNLFLCKLSGVLKKIWNEKSQMLSFGCGDKEQIIILASSFNANIANKKALQKKCQTECLNDIVLRECSGRTECHLSYDALLQGSIMQRCPNASKSGNIIIEYICEHHEIYNKTGKHIESNIMENLNITSTKFDGRATKHGLEKSRMFFKRKRVSPKREVRQNLTVNKEKFILYLIIFIFIGVWTVTMAIIYRLGQLLEKEKRKATTNNNNKNGNKALIEQQQIDQTADNYHSPGNWRNTESESSTADDRTLRDDEHGDMSNMERSDSRNIMCSNIMSADDRSSKESNTAKMSIENDDKDNTADKAILQSTSSPESSIMNESTTHQATIISQPSYINANIPLPSPPTSLMFERSSPLQSADANDPSNFTDAEIINYIPIDNDN